jgi:hypothetical protein
MISLLQIVFGFLCGGLGFWLLPESPAQGSSALLLAGFMILGGIDFSDRKQ